MRNTNKSISRAIPSCITAEISKRNRNVFDIINGTSAVIPESEPESKLCSFDRQLSPNNWVNSTKIHYQ